MIVSFLFENLTSEERRQHNEYMTMQHNSKNPEDIEHYKEKAVALEQIAIKRYTDFFTTPDMVTADIEATINRIEKHEYTGYIKETASILKRVQEALEKYQKEKEEAGEDATTHISALESLKDAAADNFRSWTNFVFDRVINCQLVALMNISGAQPGEVTFLEGVAEEYVLRIWDCLGNKYLEMFPKRKKELKAVKEILLKAEKKAKPQLPAMNPTNVDKLGFPIDKINAISTGIWGAISTEESGQLAFAFDTTNKKNKNGKEATVLCAINWDSQDIAITKHLTEWDKRVYIAVGSLFNGGNEAMTINQIHTLMGNTGDPNATQIKKINESLTKMAAARLYIDNVKERDAGYKYPLFKYDAPLLPFERLEVTHRGKTATAIKLLREPPLISFARDRKQCTTIELKTLQSPVSKTNNNLRIDDYLLERIAHMRKNPALSRKILFTSICEACQLTDKKQKQRAPETINRYLEHYQATGYITSYSIDNSRNINIEL